MKENRLGNYLKDSRINNSLTLRDASIKLKIDSMRLSELERQIALEPPLYTEREAFIKSYNLNAQELELLCNNYEIDQEAREHELKFLDALLRKDKEELIRLGISPFLILHMRED